MATGGRKTQLQALHEISVQVTPAMAAGIGGLIGVLPAGSIMGQIHNVISAAFNSTTNTFGVGTLPPPGGANLQGGISGATPLRSDNMMPNTVAGPMAVDTPIYWTAAFTGAAPTAGLWTVWIDYLPGPG
jgi:hypothetical protein